MAKSSLNYSRVINTDPHQYDANTDPHQYDAKGEKVSVTNISTMYEDENRHENSITVGQVQAPQYRDRCFGIIFIMHLLLMISAAFLFATGMIETVDKETTNADNKDDTESTESYEFPSITTLLSTVTISCIVAVALAIALMSIMIEHSAYLIKASLFFSIGMNAVSSLFFLFINPLVSAILAIICVVTVCYTAAIWNNIPFAASNLRTAATCVRSNLGMMALGVLGGVGGTILWCCLFLYVTVMCLSAKFMKNQVIESEDVDDFFDSNEELSPTGMAVMLGLMLSMYWTLQVITNVVHTTVAGTVGTWWFSPMEANSFFSLGLKDSLGRATSYSFGSICLGSLIVAIIQVIQAALRTAANNRRSNGIGRCIAECLLGLIERFAEYFNKWAFIYVGLYGYGYVDAGKNVIQLFKQRGWTNIITDQLVHRMLAMLCFGIGLVTMLVATIGAYLCGQDGLIWVAMLSLGVGSYLSSTVYQVLSSSVDTIIVLFAEAPNECQQNHPELAREMQDTWSQAWPDIFTRSSSAQTQGQATSMEMS